MVRDQVLRNVTDPNLRVYAVWETILRSDNDRAARRATTLLPDARVIHFWAPSEDIPLLFMTPVHLKEGPAWDLYMIYPPGTLWTSDHPPEPRRFMHQLGDRLPEDLQLEGDSLAAWVGRP